MLREEDFPFHVEDWGKEGRTPFSVIALAQNQLVAKGAFLAAVRQYPESVLMLRHGARIMEKHEPRRELPTL